VKALALDLGASGGKLLAGSFTGKKLDVREIHRFHNAPVEKGGHLYWDIHRIFLNLLEGLRRSAPEKISSFGIDSFCNDYGLLAKSGKLISPVYMYRDHRTEGVLERMNRVIPPEELFRRTGCQRARFNTLVQLVAQAQTPDRRRLTQAEKLLFVPDLLNYFLCGEMAAEFTIASVSQVYNRMENEWDAAILRAFDIPVGLFPEVIAPASRLGHAKRAVLDQTGMEPFSICTVGHHDTASAVAAVPSLDDHFAYISSGTWSLVGTEIAEMITSKEAFQYNFANEGGVGGRNRFSKNVMGLWLLQECQREFALRGMARTYQEMDEEAKRARPFRSLIDPDDDLFFESGDMIEKIQGKCREWGQPIPESVEEVTRCIQESLALAYRTTLEKLEEVTGLKFPCVHIIGGGAKSALLNKMAASAMKRPVLAGPYEATAIGNLCAQFIAEGEMGGLGEARRIIRASFPTREFLPENGPSWEAANERFLLIKSLHQKPGP
jgi:rhamnulokinase